MSEADEYSTGMTAGETLRSAREKKKLSLDEIAAQTRIPQRHLESLEAGEWSRLPAPTYTIGFAKSYATAVGLDRNEIGEQLRAEMGGQRPDMGPAEIFEPADPARTMPKWLVLGAIGAIVLLVVVMSWLNNRSLQPDPEPAAETAVSTDDPAQQAAPAAAATAPTASPAQGPVVLTATEPSWVQITDQGRILFQGELGPAQNYEVPRTATAPMLRAGKPEALRITVGTAVAPPVGPPGRVASDVSLLGPDLMRGPAQNSAG